jgi:hypothetical protein
MIAPPSTFQFKGHGGRKRLRDNRGDLGEQCIKTHWAFLDDHNNAAEFCRLNPQWKGYGRYQWPEGEWHE